MEIEWINDKYLEANRVMDSDWEAYEWADSLYSDFAGGLRVNTGYATLDNKVFEYLVKHLQKWAGFNKVIIKVNTSQDLVDGKMVYKVWITPFFD